MTERASEPADRSGGRLSVWLLAVVPAAMLAVLLQRPIWDVDIFWQLKLGEMILMRGAMVGQEPFAATHLGEPLPAFAWLGQVIMAEVRLLSGWTGLRIFDALVWLGGFLAIAIACRRRGDGAAGVALALGVAFYVALPTASIRPQTFAVLCFGLLLALLRLDLRPWRTTALAVPLLLLWQNLHPSVSVAAVVLGTYAAIEWLRWLRRQGAPPWERSLLAVFAGAAMLATPDGWSAIAVSGWNAQASARMGVSEWLPLWHAINTSGVLPIVLAGAIAAWFVARHRRVDPRELALALVLLAMTVLATRFVVFWALAMIPVIARGVVPPRTTEARIPRFAAPLLLLVTALSVPLLRPTYFAETIPMAALQKLRAAGVTGTVFTHVPWGGPAIDIGHPRWRVAYDGRFYRYTREEWDFYRAIGKGKAPLAEVLRRYDPAAFVLEPEWNASLIAELRAAPGWQQVSADGVAVVFRRTAAPTS